MAAVWAAVLEYRELQFVRRRRCRRRRICSFRRTRRSRRGSKGVTWFKYYQAKYRFALIDEARNRTIAWAYLKMVNEQLKVLGPMMKKLTSTGVYFTTPKPVKGCRRLPKLVEEVTSETPVMVGEFSGENESKWAMVVNLSLERSAKVVMKTNGSVKKIGIVSGADGSIAPMWPDGAIWLAGEGILLKKE